MKNHSYILLFFCFVFAAKAQTKYQKDFSVLWESIDAQFAYFDSRKTDWEQVRVIYQPIVDRVSDEDEFIRVLENVLNELYNGHISLGVNLPSSNRLIPSGSDLWAEYSGNEFVITDIREGYKADLSGLKTGMHITHFNDVPVKKAIDKFLPKSFRDYDKEVYDYAINMLLAGTHDKARKISVKYRGKALDFYPDKEVIQEEEEVLESDVLPGNIAYIKINNSLFKDELIDAFGKTVDKLSVTKAMILDLRETSSGGNTTVARAIMGKFIKTDRPYQKHSVPGEEKAYGVKRSWVEYVSPKGKVYTKPLVVLVGRWTGSMGEGLAIGFEGMGRASLAGTPMAGLLGAIECSPLPETGIGVCFPIEKLFHINGTPREDFVPENRTATGKEALERAIKLLN
ncbi:peptidase [Leptobacterium flavescens]|uniref:Peptidase n=1 Tax=Leptobacterium flavescens TaxID=472055 RepID=A0A6P0UQX4_9FLAO|nr:S41 family peptidase [Leptobacterium flavescens]NER14932.1 peptidase [Leptobacterium flavescens]